MNEKNLKLCVELAKSSNQKVVSFLFIGPSSTGKTTLAFQIAEELKCEIFSIDASPGLSKEDLEGNFTTKDKEMVFSYGEVAKAILSENANGVAVLNINEFNLFLPAVQASFNSLLDFQGRFNIAVKNETLNVNKKLIFIASLNENYEGTQMLQEAVTRRFCFTLHMDYDLAAEKELYRPFFVDDNDTDTFAALVHALRKAHLENHQYRVCCSLSEALCFLNTAQTIAPEDAFRVCVANKLGSSASEIDAIVKTAEGKGVFKAVKHVEEAAKAEAKKSPLERVTKLVSDNEVERCSVVISKYIKSLTETAAEVEGLGNIVPGSVVEGYVCQRRKGKLQLRRELKGGKIDHIDIVRGAADAS